MALKTAGSATTTTLNALQYSPVWSLTDVASFNALCKDDVNTSHPVIPFTLSPQGVLYIPNRQPIYLRPNDWVLVDTQTGFPFVLSNRAISNGAWVHS